MNTVSYSNLRFARENFNHTTRSLSNIIDMDSSTLSKYENGRRGLPSEIIKVLADTLDCSCEFILQESDSGLYAYYNDKKISLSIEQYNNLASKNLIEVKECKRIIVSIASDEVLNPLIYELK